MCIRDRDISWNVRGKSCDALLSASRFQEGRTLKKADQRTAMLLKTCCFTCLMIGALQIQDMLMVSLNRNLATHILRQSQELRFIPTLYHPFEADTSRSTFSGKCGFDDAPMRPDNLLQQLKDVRVQQQRTVEHKRKETLLMFRGNPTCGQESVCR